MTIRLNSLKETATQVALLAMGLLASTHSLAVGERIYDAILQSDFVFSRNVSNAPFFPLGYLEAYQQPSLEATDCVDRTACEFSIRRFSQGLSIPVWVTQKHMLVIGETLSSNQLKSKRDTLNLNTAGALVAWVSQPNPHWQVAAFGYYRKNFLSDSEIDQPYGLTIGGGGRHRHSSHFHSYWGAAIYYNDGDPTYYPYAGFDWYINQQWAISALLPWPAIIYAPSTNYFFRFGALHSSNEWAVDTDQTIIKNSQSQWNFGLSAEKRIYEEFWGEVRVGYSGLARYSVTSDGESVFESNIESSPFVAVSFNYRPE